MYGNVNLSNYPPSGLDNLVKSSDKRTLDWLVGMHNTLNRDKINLRELDSLVKALEHLSEDAKEDYLNTLLYPETVTGKKIPTLFPIPTTTFQMHLVCTSATTNANGNLAWTWNPSFLQDSGAFAAGPYYYSPFFLNNDLSLNGTAANANFKVVDLGYGSLPSGLYGSYRIVSASVVITYVGRMDIVSGVIGIGIGLNNSGVGTPVATNVTVADAGSSVFGSFLQVDNLYFNERTQAANGLRSIYFPIDDRYTNFLPVFTSSANSVPGSTIANCYNLGFYMAGYAQGLPVSSNSLRFDFYINVEAIVTPQFNNYIPTTSSTPSNSDAVEIASSLTVNHKDKITVPSSDIPGNSNANVGGASFLKKLAEDAGNEVDVNAIKRQIYKY